MLIRLNRMGQQYKLESTDVNQTTISLGEKKIVVNKNIRVISNSWYLWVSSGMVIQRAFPYLSNDDREFLITGLTPKEWAEIYEGRNG